MAIWVDHDRAGGAARPQGYVALGLLGASAALVLAYFAVLEIDVHGGLSEIAPVLLVLSGVALICAGVFAYGHWSTKRDRRLRRLFNASDVGSPRTDRIEPMK